MKIKLPLLTLAAALLLADAGSAVSQTSLSISNNSFELPASGGQQIYISGTGATSTFVNGWTTATTAGYWDLQYTNNTAGVTNKDGLQLLESYDVGGGLAGVVYQELTNKWVAGATYTLTARAGQAPGSGNTPNTGDTFSIDANNGGTLTQLSSTTIANTKVGLLNYTVTYTATGSEPGDGHVVVAFHVPSQANTGGMWIDDFALTSALTPDPSVTTPASQTEQPGQTATFSVTAIGTAPLSYQWQATNSAGGGFTNLLNGGPFSGANTNVLTISNVSSNNPLLYQVIVTNGLGASVTSSVARLSLVAPVLIDVDINTGSTPTQTGAAVFGTAGDTWNGVTGNTGNLKGSGNNTLSGVGFFISGNTGLNDNTGGVALMDAATTPLMRDTAYGGPSVTFTTGINGLNSYLNLPFTLVVYASIGDTNQGAKLNLAGATGGNSASQLTTTGYSRSLTNTPPVGGLGAAYQTFTGIITNSTLTITCANDLSSYSGVNGFQLQIQVPNPGITTQPVSQTDPAGTTVVFSVVPSGNSPFGYQWQANGGTGYTNLSDGGQLAGSSSNVLTLAGITTNQALAYQVIVTNSSGSVTSSPASLTVLTVPVITTQPVSQTTIAGGQVLFSVAAVGAVPLNYQWQATNSATGGFTNLADGGPIVGSQSNLLTLTGVSTNWPLAYQVIVANSYGSVTSSVANLTVLPFVAPPVVPNPGAMGPSLAANVSGNCSAPPPNLVSSKVTGGLVAGNGDLGITVGGPSSALKFYVGKADFFGVLRGAITPVGSLTLSAPALNGSSYSLNENIGSATLTGAFANGASSLTVTSWVAAAENTAVIQLNNSGSQPLALTSQLLDGLALSAGNPATYGSTNNSTWLYVSPDTVYVELGNQLHNNLGTAPFTGKIADFRLFTQALSGATLAALDNVGAPTPLLRWSPTNSGTATLMGNASLNGGDPHGGSVSVNGGSDEVAVGDMPLPENQFTFSTWINVASTGVNGNIVTAQIPFAPLYGYPYPYPRGLTLRLVNGALSASLNQSGVYMIHSGADTQGNDQFNADAVNKFATTAGSPIPANQWVQAAVTYDGNVLRIYTNGVQVGVTAPFPTGINGMLGWNKLAVHIGDTNVPYNGCAPQAVLVQNILGATTTTNSQGALAFMISAGGQVTIALAAVTDRNKTNYFAAAQQQTQAATTGSLSNLFLAHNAWWSNFWTKSFVQIPNQRIQDSWYASLYLLACCSVSNAPAPGLWGNFVTATTPEWLGDYTLNYNYQSPFLGALACNHTELAENYDQPLLDQMGRGRAAAQDIFGGNNNGLYFLCHLIPFPGPSDDIFGFEGMKSSSVFAAVDCVTRWRYTRDPNYASKIYPFLKGVADFWDNYLVDTGGYYVDYNDSWSEFTGNDTNPAMTLAFIRHVYPSLVEISQLLNQDAGRRAKWNDIIARLSPLPIVPASSIASLNALGAPYNAPGVNVIRATSSGGAFYPNPAVTLYQDHAIRGNVGQGPMTAIYPGWNIGLESDPYTLQAAYNTVWLTGSWFDYNANNFSYPSAACVGFDPIQILTNLDTLLALYRNSNFMIDVGGGGTEQFSVVPGTLAAMFVQSYQTNIHVFPNWPTNQSATFGNLNACGGFLVSGAITLGSANYLQIQSTAGQMLKLVNPWPGAAVQCVSSLTGISTLSGTVLYYQTQVGEVLTLTSTLATNLPAPANLTASLSGGSALLTWNGVPGAGGYNVKRATSIGGPYLNVTSGITATNFNDGSLTGHTTYYYAVTALAPGFESTNSAVVTVAPPVIANGSFEANNVPIPPGYETSAFPTSWSSANASGPVITAVVTPYSGDGRFASYPVPGMDGTNYCQIFMNGGSGGEMIYQDLGAANKYQAGTTYTLTAAFGLERGIFPTGTLVLCNSALTPIATKTITSAMLNSNAFTSYSVTYTATGSEGGNGDIVVGFSTTGAAAGNSFDVDNVRLTALAPVSTNAYLTSLVLNPAGALTPAFASNVLSYVATEAYGSSPTVTVVNANGNATNQLVYNGVTNVLASGVASAALTLNPNPPVTNVVQVQVTAQNGVTMQTYTVNVTRLPNQATQPNLTNSVTGGTLNLSWGSDRMGYRLLVQTNNLNQGVSSNPNDWATVIGSTATNALAIPIVTTNFDEYYRLVYP